MILISPGAYNIYHHQLEYYNELNFPDNPVISKLKDRTVCLPYEFKKIFPHLQVYVQNMINGLNSKKNRDWINCLHYYSDSEHLIRMEEILKIILIPPVDPQSWISVFESTFQALIHTLYSNEDETINRWRQIFRTICDPVPIDKYRFNPQVQNEIELRNFGKSGNLDYLRVSNSINNVISKSKIKLEIMNSEKALAVIEILDKAKSWSTHTQNRYLH